MKTKAKEDLLNNIQSLKVDLEYHNSNLPLAILTHLSYTADEVDKYLDKNMTRYVSVNRTAYQILLILANSDGGMIQTELSSSLFRSRYTITRIIDLLEKRKLVKRSADKIDRRANKVLLTQKGVDVLKSSINGRVKIGEAAVECLDEDEQKTLRVLIRKLRKHLIALNKSMKDSKESEEILESN
jgi:DNA-binding MarR family transcriptional regulator